MANFIFTTTQLETRHLSNEEIASCAVEGTLDDAIAEETVVSLPYHFYIPISVSPAYLLIYLDRGP